MTGEHVVILHCLGWVTQGGVERRRVTLSGCLEDRNLRHVLICQVASPPLSDMLKANGWELHEIGQARHALDIPWFVRGLRVAKSVNPDIIHGAVFEGNLLAAFIGMSFRQAKVVVEETSNANGRRLGGNLLFFLIALRANVIIGVAPQIAAQLRKRLGRLSSKVRLVTNGVPEHVPLYKSREGSLRRLHGIRKKDLVLGSTGRLLDNVKRFSDIISILPSLEQNFPAIKLLIVGDGPDRVFLESLIAEYSLEAKVVLVGYQEEPRDFLELMDVFVLASSSEALPLALIEAMHAGVPCIASDVGGNPFVLDNGAAGILFTSGDVAGLERSIGSLLGSPEMREEMGNRARTRARTFFGSTRYASEVMEVWENLLKK